MAIYDTKGLKSLKTTESIRSLKSLLSNYFSLGVYLYGGANRGQGGGQKAVRVPAQEV